MSDTEEKPTMAAAMRRKDLLGTTASTHTHLFASFLGIQQVFKRFFKIAELPFVHSNDVKAFQRKKYSATYPYAYVSITSVGTTENSIDIARARKHATGMTVHEANSTLTKHYFFPITMKVEFHFLTNDFMAAIRFIADALIISQSKTLNFELKTGPVKGFVTITPETKDIQLPRSDRENEAEPEAFDLVLNFSIDTWTGVSRETAKVNNNGDVEMTVQIAVDPDLLTVIDEETTILRTAAINEET